MRMPIAIVPGLFVAVVTARREELVQHCRQVLLESWLEFDRADGACAEFHATRNPGAGQDFTGLAAAVQLRLRVALGSQTLIVKLRLLPGWNTVRIRGDPPVSMLP